MTCGCVLSCLAALACPVLWLLSCDCLVLWLSCGCMLYFLVSRLLSPRVVCLVLSCASQLFVILPCCSGTSKTRLQPSLLQLPVLVTAPTLEFVRQVVEIRLVVRCAFLSSSSRFTFCVLTLSHNSNTNQAYDIRVNHSPQPQC
jgi:hypothetical protein